MWKIVFAVICLGCGIAQAQNLKVALDLPLESNIQPASRTLFLKTGISPMPKRFMFLNKQENRLLNFKKTYMVNENIEWMTGVGFWTKKPLGLPLMEPPRKTKMKWMSVGAGVAITPIQNFNLRTLAGWDYSQSFSLKAVDKHPKQAAWMSVRADYKF